MPKRGNSVEIALICAALLALPAAAPAWDDDPFDSETRFREQIAAVNEGQLAFLVEHPVEPVHHHVGRILINPQSLETGWVVLEQCHVNLDRVAAAQIVFNPRKSRNLSVSSIRNIAAAHAEANSVQLRDIGSDSEVCLRAESQALHRLDEGVYELRNGPFMRRFLDGYYPLQLTLRIEYPAGLSLVDHDPLAQPGFVVLQGPGWLGVESLFEGELRTAFRFVRD